MPSNNERINHMARTDVENKLRKLVDYPDGLVYADVVRDTILKFPVSSSMVRRFIKECYIDPGYIRDYDGTLTIKNKWW